MDCAVPAPSVESAVTDAVRAVPGGGVLRFRSGVATSAGNRRTRNEDAHGATSRLCVVADGIGGQTGGALAAAIAVDTVVAALEGGCDVAAVRTAVAAANSAVRARAHHDGLDGMGTTLVGAIIVHDGATEAVAVVHVGDSRCYRWRDGVLDCVTSDHSLVNDLVAGGRLDPGQVAGHPLSNVITRALGPEPVVEPDLVVLGARAGRLLLCSDGLSDELPARTIGRVLAGIADPHAAAARLVQLTLAGNACDNVTALVIDTVIDTVIDADPSGGVRRGPSALDTAARFGHHVTERPMALTSRTTRPRRTS